MKLGSKFMYCYASKISIEREIEELGDRGGLGTKTYGCDLSSLTEYIDLLLFFPYHCLMLMLLLLML